MFVRRVLQGGANIPRNPFASLANMLFYSYTESKLNLEKILHKRKAPRTSNIRGTRNSLSIIFHPTHTPLVLNSCCPWLQTRNYIRAFLNDFTLAQFTRLGRGLGRDSATLKAPSSSSPRKAPPSSEQNTHRLASHCRQTAPTLRLPAPSDSRARALPAQER